jgi:fluoride exporter
VERRAQAAVIAAVAAGGVAGAEARYGIGLAMPHTDRQFPWATLTVNLTGCLAIGMLMVLLLELTSPHHLARPFLGIGLLGGYTTFSTFSVETERLLRAHRAGVALLYVTASAIGCMLAVWIGTAVAQLAGRAVMDARMRRGER